MPNGRTKEELIKDMIDMSINHLSEKHRSVLKELLNENLGYGEEKTTNPFVNSEIKYNIVTAAMNNIRSTELLRLKPDLIQNALNNLLDIDKLSIQEFLFNGNRPPCSAFPGIWPFCNPNQ